MRPSLRALHRDADGCGGQRGCIVDPITDHHRARGFDTRPGSRVAASAEGWH